MSHGKSRACTKEVVCELLTMRMIMVLAPGVWARGGCWPLSPSSAAFLVMQGGPRAPTAFIS